MSHDVLCKDCKYFKHRYADKARSEDGRCDIALPAWLDKLVGSNVSFRESHARWFCSLGKPIETETPNAQSEGADAASSRTLPLD